MQSNDFPVEEAKAKMLSKVAKRPSVNIEFRNLSYRIGTKKILKGIDGKFSTGRLTAILGASGAGKTSLLNILAGQIHVNVNGTIKVNGKHRDMRTFHKMSSYIMQEDLLQPFLTVGESMKTAAKLKLGRDFSNEAKEDTIREIIKLIGLKECVDIEVEKLSGGQRKRLSIALELVNNPPVIFLDEPTSGLDNVTMKNCIDLLKSLTLQGRTIICTIHQPSDSIFEMFDHVYFMSDGCCIYNGEVNNIVPYLDSVGLPCPKTYSPADYIIELVHFNRENNELLCQRMVNEINSMSTNEEIKKKQADNGDDHYSFDFPNSFWHQFWILTCRMFLQLSRNKLMLGLQFGHHIICGVFLGSMFYQIGNDGRYAAVNMKFYYGVVTYYFFTHLMSPVLLFPFEVKLMQREYFNRWYGLKAYYLASTITMMPILIINAILFTLIIYPMTGQPLELDKFFWFLFFSVFTAISAQGLGYAVGSIFPPTSGACIGSAIAIPLVLLGIYGIGFGETIEPTMKTLQYFSFPYHSFVGIATALMDGRDTFECEDIFCYFGDPEMMLRIMGMHDKTYVSEAAFMVFFMLLHRVLSYIFLRFRVSQEFALLTSRYIGQIK